MRTCYGSGGACGSAAAGSAPGTHGRPVTSRVPSCRWPSRTTTAPGGTFFLPGFQREGDYLLSNIRLVETATGRVLANAEPSLATLHVGGRSSSRSATVTRLTLADLQARGITITQQDFNAFGYVGGPGGPDGFVPGAAKWKLGRSPSERTPARRTSFRSEDPGAPGSAAWGQFKFG